MHALVGDLSEARGREPSGSHYSTLLDVCASPFSFNAARKWPLKKLKTHLGCETKHKPGPTLAWAIESNVDIYISAVQDAIGGWTLQGKLSVKPSSLRCLVFLHLAPPPSPQSSPPSPWASSRTPSCSKVSLSSPLLQRSLVLSWHQFRENNLRIWRAVQDSCAVRRRRRRGGVAWRRRRRSTRAETTPTTSPSTTPSSGPSLRSAGKSPLQRSCCFGSCTPAVRRNAEQWHFCCCCCCCLDDLVWPLASSMRLLA